MSCFKIFVCFFLFFPFKNGKSQVRIFNLYGHLKNQKTGIVSLSYIDTSGKKRKDTCMLKKGYFHFEGTIKEPTLAMLRGDVKTTADDDPNAVGFYLDSGDINVLVERGRFKGIKIEGSASQTEYELLRVQEDNINRTDSFFLVNLLDVNYNFILTHPNSYVSAFRLALFQSRWSLDSVRILYNNLGSDVRKSFYGREVGLTIEELDANSPGRTARDFTVNDINKERIRLSDFRGSYVLLDFWASWCVPCRKSTPHLIDIFKKYHEHGLNIISLSDDIRFEDWKDAVEKDSMGIWFNALSGLTINNNEIDDSRSVSKIFAVQVLPTKILIDKTGMILGRYSGSQGEAELDSKLSELFHH